MKNVKFEKKLEIDIKLNKEAINKLELQEQIEIKLKNANNNIDKKDYKSKEEKFYYYILSFINIIYIYLLNRKEEKKILIEDEQRQNKMNLNKNEFSEYKDKLKKDFNFEEKKVNIKKYDKNRNKINRFSIK